MKSLTAICLMLMCGIATANETPALSIGQLKLWAKQDLLVIKTSYPEALPFYSTCSRNNWVIDAGSAERKKQIEDMLISAMNQNSKVNRTGKFGGGFV